jgi:nitrite reductase/ring-hydroxylating ferredoxin subunit
MVWTKALAANDLPPGSRQVVKLDQKAILLLNENGTIHAVSNQCPHLKLPMKSGKIENGAIVCPFHRSAFDLCSGAVKEWSPFPPVVGALMGKMSAEKALPVFPVRVENGEVQVDLAA